MKYVLALNVGSSSVKSSLYQEDAGALRLLKSFSIDCIGSQAQMCAQLLDAIAVAVPLDSIMAVGHRVVHGGDVYTQPTAIDDAVIAQLDSMTELAPLHMQPEVEGMRIFKAHLPHAKHVACFDTAFHATQSDVARMLPLPRRYFAAGIKRYGFHGLSYEYIAGKLHEVAPQVAHGRVIVAHLGSGASVCALHEGKSIATSMGFTALDGLVMGTRTGSIDAGAILYIAKHEQLDLAGIEKLLYHESGLKGISGISNDMRALENSDAPEAKQAIDVFCYRLVREIGSMAAALGGVDALVFTAGIGEHSAMVRSRVVDALQWLGTALDADANARHAQIISSDGVRLPVFVLPTDEALMIAQHTLKSLA